MRTFMHMFFLGAMGTSFILHTNKAFNIAFTFYVLLTLCYAIGKVFMEIFFVIRLYTSFKGSSFAISKHTLGESGILIVIISVLWCYTWLSDQSNIHIQWIALGAEMFLIVVLSYLFVSRLSKLILMQKTDKQSSIEMSSTKSMPTVSRLPSTPSAMSPSALSVPSQNDGYNESKSSTIGKFSDTDEESHPNANQKVVRRSRPTITTAAEMQMTLSETQNKLIYVITRSIVLSSIAMITTILFSVYAFFYVSFGTNGLFILYILWTVDMTTNSICIYLNFKHSKSSYDRYCGLFHGCIQFLIRRCSAKRIINDNVRKLEKYQASTELKTNVSTTKMNDV